MRALAGPGADVSYVWHTTCHTFCIHVKIAFWSGPRNLSTAMMYAFAARGFAVRDEPFYSAYLAATGADHPMRDAVLASQPTDPSQVAADLANDQNSPCYYKLMAHHMVDGFPLDWADICVNVHLIRHPARVIASYEKKHAAQSLEDIGFPQQLALFERLGGVVIDSYAIRQNPAVALGKLCQAIQIPFENSMLNWSPGSKPFDGVWAPYWYHAVHRSTGFAGPEGPLPDLSGDAQALCDAALPFYRAMADRALT